MIKLFEIWNGGFFGAAEAENLFLMILDLKFLLRIPRKRSFPINIYLFKINNRNTRKRCVPLSCLLFPHFKQIFSNPPSYVKPEKIHLPLIKEGFIYILEIFWVISENGPSGKTYTWQNCDWWHNSLWVIQIVIFNVTLQIRKMRGTTKMEKIKWLLSCTRY